MSDTVIKVEKIGKQYRLGERGAAYATLRDSLSNLFKPQSKSEQHIWALKDVSFNVKQGEKVGIIGRNGAGKSTLLKILSRITEPTAGRAEIFGRVGSLLEVGSGFHGELTGRENIFLNGAILGMRRQEILEKFDEIVSFSELEKFIDTPVKFYSSGMYIRLGFAVAAHLQTEILLIDEVLAVGDIAFQQKCLGKIDQTAQSGRTIFFVSHNMGAIKHLCPRTILVDQGQIAFDGNTDQAISRYLDRNMAEGALASTTECDAKAEGANKANPTFRFLEVGLYNHQGYPAQSFVSDEPITLKVKYECLKSVTDLKIRAYLADENNEPLVQSNNVDDPSELKWHNRERGIYESAVVISPQLLGQKNFYVSLNMVSPTAESLKLNKILRFDVQFKGYNNLHDTLHAYIRPRFSWQTKQLKDFHDKK